MYLTAELQVKVSIQALCEKIKPCRPSYGWAAKATAARPYKRGGQYIAPLSCINIS